MRLWLIVFTLLALESVARAADCPSATSRDQCAQRALQKADDELNALYKSILSRLKDDAAKTKYFVEAEGAWLKFRTAECAFEASARADESRFHAALIRCREQLTTERAKFLRTLVQCSDHGTACQVAPSN